MAHNFLRRLELQGFKSFAGKTVFEFPARVTAVVGPNGSGKSNVIDALRWVLGEREAKQLRGDTTQNLIFSGTPKRPAVSLAKVSLVFDNLGKEFPVDAPEVELSRRVDRSGVSEFYLHDAEIKLRDLTPMLAKARLGSRGLTMIGQGQSDLFVRSSPAERRAMIEEILGLREFRIKKTQAERRLESSASNAEKARALIEELGPHLRLLRRQKQRWDKRSEIEAELRDLENSYFAERYKSLQALIHTSGSPLPALEEAMQKQREEIAKLSGEVSAAEAASFDANKGAGIRKELESAFDERSNYVRELAKLEARRELQAASPAPQAIAANPATLLESVAHAVTRALAAPSIEEVRSILADVPVRIASFLKPQANPARPVAGTPGPEEEKISKRITELDARIADLRAREEQIAKDQEIARRAFKDRIEELEAKKNALRDLESKLQAAKFEEEKVRFKIEDLEGDWKALGRNIAELSELKAPGHDFDAGDAERRMPRLRGELAAIGEIDENTIREADETEQRYEFLTRELADLEAASVDLRTLIRELDNRIHHDFKSAFKAVNDAFNEHFVLMFGGGKARLLLEKIQPKSLLAEGEEAGDAATDEVTPETDPELSAGVEIELSIPRKRITSLEMLSGGEKSLVSLAALFALISVSPPPFLVLDEIDAPLDEENARRFSDLVKSFSGKTQFIIVTHNRSTMEAADVLYGVTMGDDGVSKVLSLKLEN